MAVAERRAGEKSHAQSKKRADESVLDVGVIRSGDVEVVKFGDRQGIVPETINAPGEAAGDGADVEGAGNRRLLTDGTVMRRR